MKKLLTFIATILLTLSCFADPNYVYHEASTNTIGPAATRFRDILTPNRTQPIKIGFKIEFQFFWDRARIYYTTDGSTPSGAFGVGNGTTQVLTAVFDYNFGSPLVDVVTATIPTQPAGTTVRYIVSAWSSTAGGDEIFGNGCGNAPRTFCSVESSLSSNATVFSYKVEPLRYYVNDGSQVLDVFTNAVGNDVNDGLTPWTPKATVQAIINSYTIVASDTILIDHGTYTQSFTITNADKGSIVSGTPFRANYLVIKGAGHTKTLFTAAAASKFNLFINRAEYIWVEGISFSNSNATDSSFNIVKEYGNSSVIRLCKLNNTSTTVPSGRPAINIFLRSTKNTSLGAQRTLITNNIIDNSSQEGIGVFVYGDVDSSRIQFNTITMTGSNGRGVLFDCLFNAPDEVSAGANYWPVVDTVFKNTITANNHGIECNSSSTSNKLYTYLIEGNTITINNTTAPRSSIYLYNCGKPSAEDFKIMKNRLRGGYAGIYIFDRGEYLKIYNNYICSIFGLFSNNYIGGGTDRENEFLHNSLYTTGSCLYFNNNSQDDWDVRNNILYTTANSPSACINVVSWTNSGYNFESLNGNLFYRTGTAFIGRFNSSTYSTLALWQGQDISFNSTNDPNSLERIPPYQNASNCDLDLVQDLVNWGGTYNGYPNRNTTTGFGVDLRSTVTSDFKNIPSRAFPTIGAFEVGSAILPINEGNMIRNIRNEKQTKVYYYGGNIYTQINNDVLTKQHIIIFDASGKTLYKNTVMVKEKTIINLIHYLCPGVNFIKVNIENKTYDQFIFKILK